MASSVKWSKCRFCRGLITWGTGPDGRPEPLDPDGTTHIARCPALRTRGGRGKRLRTLVKPKAC